MTGARKKGHPMKHIFAILATGMLFSLNVYAKRM
jgi:hypothetical protein